MKCLKYLKKIFFSKFRFDLLTIKNPSQTGTRNQRLIIKNILAYLVFIKTSLEFFIFPSQGKLQLKSDTFTNSSRLLLKLCIRNKILLKMFWDWHSFLIWRLSNSLLLSEIDTILPKLFLPEMSPRNYRSQSLILEFLSKKVL